MQSIILAAGRGNRLQPITNKIPKSLVEVNGISFLENDLNALSKYKNIKEAIIVVGYKKELIIKKFGNNYKNIKLKYIENKNWEVTNNIYSLWLASKHINNDFLLLEGDIFFEHDILDFIFKNREKNISYLSKYQYNMSGTVVEIDEKGKKMMSGAIVEMDSQVNNIIRLIPSNQQGKNFDFSNKYKTVNIYYFTYDFFKKYFEPSLNIYIKTHGEDNFYELILGILIYLNTPNISGHIIDRKKWYEVDTEDDLEMANYLFSKDDERIDRLSNLYGGYWKYSFIDFCFLFNLYFPPEHFYSKLANDLPLLINNYPSAQHKICSYLSRWYSEDGFVKSNILVGNGASEFIKILNRHFIKKITVPVPSFNEYEDLEKSQLNYFKLREKDNFILNTDDYIDSVKKSSSNFALIINPNNPTSTLTRREDLLKILKKLNHLNGIIVDESFIDFTGNREKFSIQPFVNKFPNLVVIRSLSKEFGIPGLRLGYLLTSNNRIKEQIKKYLPIWNINSLAERFVELFPRYQREYNKSIKQIIKDNDNFRNELTHVDMIKVIDGKANFLFCKILNNDINSKKLRNILFSKYNMLIKDCSNKTSLNDSYIRISVRKPDDNSKMVEALKEVFN